MILASPLENTTQGDQRSIHIQLTNNKRRIKRGSKRKRKSTKSTLDRVIYIFKNGNLNDYTHPKEVDPYWDTLYRQYEYLVYIEYIYRLNLKKNCILLNDEEISSLIEDMTYIRNSKKLLASYLMNFMNVMYGSVIQRRFWGWKKYIDDFISKFNDVAIMNLFKLKFDPNQTRCSVYFYQAFWLSGLSMINKISDEIKKYDTDETTNSNDYHQAVIEEDFDTLYDTYGSDAIDVFNTLEESEPISEEVDEIEVQIIEEEIPQEPEENLDPLIENTSFVVHTEKENQAKSEIVDFELACVLQKLLYQLNINIDSLHDFSDKTISKLGRVIKKKINTGEIILQDADKKLLITLFSSSLLK